MHCLPGPGSCPGPRVRVRGRAEAGSLGAGQQQAAWPEHSRPLSSDPVVASLSQDVFKELSQIEACQGPMQTRLIPTLVSIMQAPADKIPAGLCAVRPRPYRPAPPLTSRDVFPEQGWPWARDGGASHSQGTPSDGAGLLRHHPGWAVHCPSISPTSRPPPEGWELA